MNELALSKIQKTERTAWAAATVAAVLLVLGLFIDSKQFFSSYLMGFMYVVGIPLCCLGLVMLNNLVGGGWGKLIRPYTETGLTLMPFLPILFIPVFFGFHKLYPWTHMDGVPAIEAKKAYLNPSFFWFRTVFYFVVWASMASYFKKKMNVEPGSPAAERLKASSAVGIIVFMLTITFASFDWVMSLDPLWYSSIFGIQHLAQFMISTFAFLIIMVGLTTGPNVEKEISITHLHDLGKFLFMSIMFWAYTSFSQYLIIWSARIPEETLWYHARAHGVWRFVTVALIVFQFFVPFMILLSRNVKRKLHQVTKVALWLLIMRVIEQIWIIRPTTHESSGMLHWMDFAGIIGVGGLGLAMYLSTYRKIAKGKERG